MAAEEMTLSLQVEKGEGIPLMATTTIAPYYDVTGTVIGNNTNNMRLCPEPVGNFTEDDTFYATAQMVTGLFIYPAFCFPGLVGNILTVVVLSQRNMLTSTNAFLSALAVSDSIKLVNDILYFFVTLFFHVDPVLGNLSYGYLYPYAHFIFSMSVCVSSWLTVSVAVERYILVCHPTRARNIWSRKRAVTLCCVIYVVMTSLALPSAFRYRTIRCFDVQLNASRLEVELTEMWQDEFFVTSYTWAQNLLRSIIPLVVLVVLNVCIIRAVRRTKVKKRKNSRHRVTVMMIVVILAFLICITPDAILSTVFGRGYHEAGNVTKGIREITDTLLTINAAVNFIIYCALNKVFRKSFAHLCCPRKRAGDGWVTEMDESVYRRFSEAKLSMLSSNNNHSAGRHVTDSPSGNMDNSLSPSTPKYIVSSDGNNEKRSKYSSLPCNPSSPESPGFSSERTAFFSSSLSNTSTASTKSEDCSGRFGHRRNRRSINYHRNSWNTHPHKGTSHGLKKSRNSVKCNRGKRMLNDKANGSSGVVGGIHNESVTYIPQEEFQNSHARRFSAKRHRILSKTPSDCEVKLLNSDKFVLNLRNNSSVKHSAESLPLSPDSCPSPTLSHNDEEDNGSPATLNSDVANDDRLQSDVKSLRDDKNGDHGASTGSDNSHSLETISSKQNGFVAKGNTRDEESVISSPHDNNMGSVDTAKCSVYGGETRWPINGNRNKKRTLTVSFSDC